MPETFVIGKGGCIAYKQIGPLSVENLEKTTIPLIERLKQKPPPPSALVRGADIHK